LTRQPVTAAIHPELLDRLNQALTPVDFTEDSTLYNVGYEQAKTDFKRLLNYHLNRPTG